MNQPSFVFDAHVDSVLRSVDLGQDLGLTTPGHLDLVRGRAGGLGAVVLTAWCEPRFVAPGDPGATRAPAPAWHAPAELRPPGWDPTAIAPDLEPLPGTGGAFQRTRLLVEAGRALTQRHPDQACLALNGHDLAEARQDGRVAVILGIEGGHAIESSLTKLGCFHELGVRLMTLVWNNHLPWIRSCRPVPDDLGFEPPAGLSAMGHEVVERMNELGMLVDLSHASDQAFADTLGVSRAPVLASHSGCRSLHDHPRNLTDAQLRQLGDAGGCVGVVFHGGFLSAEAAAADAAIYARPDYRAIGQEPGTELHANGAARWQAKCAFHQREAAPFSVELVADHVLHAVDHAGLDAVGIGSDFDGIPRTPDELRSAADYPRLADALVRRGMTSAAVDAVLGENLARLFTTVTSGVGALP
ncbi:MAG: membrane dipeptidase [Planctomycetota bacterium]|nr:membrane dipeptidase [Planctomycetota bacterium]